MNVLSIDIETFSSADIAKGGVYKYVEADDFRIMLFAYKVDNQPVQIVDLTKVNLPTIIEAALVDPRVLKTAYNANFERVCLSKHLGIQLDPAQWDCTMIRAARAGWPMNLGATAKAMGLQQEKMESGKALIRYFSIPCKPTKANGGRTRNLPQHAPEKWEEFMAYCVQDVVVESEIRSKVIDWYVPKFETLLWNLDQRINDAGIELDMQFVNNAIDINSGYVDKLHHEAVMLTGLENPNSVSQIIGWMNRQGEAVETLRKADVKELLEGEIEGDARRLLEIRQEMAKTSVKKYAAMQQAVGRDSRVRGLFQFYGANRTGRWGGRLIQPQNLPQNHIKDLELARNVVRSGDGEALELLYGNVPDTLSQLIRTAFVAGEGKRFIVADFSAIEARVIAWLAGEQWRLDVFNTHGKIYEASASQMFGIPLEEITKELRQKGKVAELALGYQGGVGAMEAMGALNMGLTKKELKAIVKAWRKANPAIVELWNASQEAVYNAITYKGQWFEVRGVKVVSDDTLTVALPSGRNLCYVNPRIVTIKYWKVRTKDTEILAEYLEDPTVETWNYVSASGKMLPFMAGDDAPREKWVSHLVYDGMDQTTKQWKAQETYGGKLVENMVQAIARDCLAVAMLRLDEAGYKIALHVHDEVVLEMPYGKGSIEEVNRIMGLPIKWAPGLPLKAESFETEFYKKD
ncbi:DNA polymerase [Dyadobacter fermentans]|uniref:DNA polymerase n=1 Tax=Dyadobacter fermentans TaxID=94254 RepID=UPI001CBF8E31|nr:DNA polymerase [Dyadobacter fermentans]MBZ1361978.1 DNA polymerase [Dyadobacter fermentans]